MTSTPPLSGETTQHGMLVAFGHFAHEIGLLDQLRQITIPQKTVVHSPTAKLTTFFMGLLTGIDYLTDLTQAPAPLYRDPALAPAWGLAALPEASGVSRTLTACTPQSLTDLHQALETVTQPFLQRALTDLRLRNHPLVLDIDLTGQPLSDTSTVYPDAAFGYMDGEVRLGYQIAAISVQTELYGRQWLAGQHHPGHTVSAPCLLTLLAEAERRLGCHPRRRVELLDTRIASYERWIVEWTAVDDRYSAQAKTVATAENQARQQWREAEWAVWRLQRFPKSDRQDGPYGALTQAQARVERFKLRTERLSARWTKLIRQAQRYRTGVAWAQEQIRLLAERRAHFAAENAAQPDAPRCRMRMDAGFSSGDNLTELLELGYDIDTKAKSHSIATALLKQVTPETVWTRVGKNAEMVAWPEYTLPQCPYPLVAGLERFHTPHGMKYAVLLRNPEPGAGRVVELPQWFAEYNQRGTIEAGIKQSKTVFRVQHPMSRSRIGMHIQLALTLFAANFLTWVRPWLMDRLSTAKAVSMQILQQVKTLVRIAANSAGWLEQTATDIWLYFHPASSLAGVGICLTAERIHQLELPLFERDRCRLDPIRGN